MSRLLEAKWAFTENIAKLILWCYAAGYQVTLGEGYDDDGAGHMKDSLHYSGLAQDLNLFKDGVYLDKTEDHARPGAEWEQLHPDNNWGGWFNDGNHYSMSIDKRK